MSTFFAHLRKEWRDQRAILLGIAVAIPLLLVAGLWLLGDTVSRVECATPFIVAGAVALPMLALSTELFAGESRRNTQRFLRRLPLGLLRAWAAKVFFYLLVVTVTAAYAAAAFLCVAALFGGPERAGAVEQELTQVGMTWPMTGAVVAVGLWILLVSTWIPKGGAAAGVALLMLGGIAAPVYLTMKTQPHFLLGWSAVPTLVWVFVLAPVVLSAWCWCRGARFASGLFAPVLRGLPVVLLLAGGGLAYGAHAYDRWMELDPSDPQCRLSSVFVGEGDRFAFVNAYRVDSRGEGIEGTERPWAIDLKTQEVRRLAPPGYRISSPDLGIGIALDRTCGSWKTLQIVGSYEPSLDSPIRWVDAENGTIWKTLPIDAQPPELMERVRDEARRHAIVRLADGRRAWMVTRWFRSGSALRFARRLERDTADGGVEGEDLPESIHLASWPSRFGWAISTSQGFAHVSGESGSTIAPLRIARGVEVYSRHWISPHSILVREWTKPHGGTWTWKVQDVETGAKRPIPELPAGCEMQHVVDATRVLAFVRGQGKVAGLHWLDTRTGALTPLPPLPGSPTGALYASVDGVLPSGSLVVTGADSSGQGFCERLDTEGHWVAPVGWASGVTQVATATEASCFLYDQGGRYRFGTWGTRAWEPLLRTR